MADWDNTASNVDDAAFGGSYIQAPMESFSLDPDSYSKHDNGGCYNCGDAGHMKSECPEPRKGGGGCFNCGEEGHNKSDCPNPYVPREFTGTCRSCGQEGHRAAECPSAAPRACRACGEEGHVAADCENSYKIYDDSVPIMSPEEAWVMLEQADKSKEILLIKQALNAYTRSMPELTFQEMDQEFRKAGFNTHLVAKEQTIPDTMTIVNLQGKKDCEYVVSFQFSYKPTRPKFAAGWPSSPEDNATRLANAGYPMDRHIPKCGNCGELGHIRKSCPQDLVEREKTVIKCYVCDEPGHYGRDCTQPRKTSGGGCRNCGQPGHKASDCTEPRNMDNVECKVCSETGHFAKDCPTRPAREPFMCRNCGEERHKASDCTQERKFICRNCDGEGHSARDCPEPPNPAKQQCRNCDQMGHMSRECPKPRDYSRVQCTVCSEFGHTRVRCKQTPKLEESSFDGNGNGYGDYDSIAASGPATTAADVGTSDWENAGPTPSHAAATDADAATAGAAW